ncbi:MAG: DUF47 family protein [Bacteroidales bacterium]|jgi:predicted phosphate transport protein (TIGR00153 family)|nr:DUF47 family protein [Bacteroidales bacterium]
MNNSFFAIFMPKEPKFVTLLTRMAQVSADAATIMVDCVKSTNIEKSLEYAKGIKAQEKQGDTTILTIFDELNTTFITPFDREDIHNLANGLDDITDNLNLCAKKIIIYQHPQLPKSAETIALLVECSAKKLVEAIQGLSNIKKNAKHIRRCCREVRDMENQADDIYEEFLTNLFANEQDMKEIIKLKSIMRELEKTANAIKTVGKTLQTIIIKYA